VDCPVIQTTPRPTGTTPNASPSPVHILWTGGWDSTFRVLDLLFRQHRTVQPHYLIDPGRPSVGSEIKAMARMRRRMQERLPDPDALRPTLFTDEPGIRKNPDITGAWTTLAARNPLGEQYEWIARYAAMQGLESLELSVHIDDRAYLFLDGHIEEIRDGNSKNYRLKPDDDADRDLGLVFGRLHFPLLHISKLDMQAAADQAGFRDIMEMTWFCHNPKRGKPCGMCFPCQFALDEGMARRLPLPARMKCQFVSSKPGIVVRSSARKLLRRGQTAR